MFNHPHLATKYLYLALTKKLRHVKRLQRVGKGNKEGYATFGSLSEHYLKAWLAEFQPNGSNISGESKWGTTSMLGRRKQPLLYHVIRILSEEPLCAC